MEEYQREQGRRRGLRNVKFNLFYDYLQEQNYGIA